MQEDLALRLLRQLITADSSGVVPAHRWFDRLAAQLDLIIGEMAVHALCRRSLQFTSARFAWLATAEGLEVPSAQRFAQLAKSLQHHDPVEAEGARTCFIVSFVGLLVSLIGEALTAQIMGIAMRDGHPFEDDAGDQSGR